MARFFAVVFRTAFGLVMAGGFGFTLSRADAPMTMAPVLTNAPGKVSPGIAAATNAPAPMPPQDTLNRYGSILVPGDEAAHPLRLKMPFPGVGEVKVPNAGEMAMRVKLEQLAVLSDGEIHAQLEKWPAYSTMSLHDQGAMLMRIQDFREYRSKIAQQKARDMGLLTLTSDQQKRFEKDYWDKRLQLDRDLAKQFEPIYRDRDQKFKDDLYREFSAISGVPVVQGLKPPAPPVTKPPAPTPPAPMPAKGDAAVGTNSESMMQQK